MATYHLQHASCALLLKASWSDSNDSEGTLCLCVKMSVIGKSVEIAPVTLVYSHCPDYLRRFKGYFTHLHRELVNPLPIQYIAVRPVKF